MSPESSSAMAKRLPKRAQMFLPLWKRDIEKYPLYWKGNPQLRIFLPQFWMKMIYPKSAVPPNIVHFEVHHQMTKLDVKNYLEKIYKVPVARVNINMQKGEKQVHPTKGYEVIPKKEKRFAFVTLGEGQTFKFPELYGKDNKETPSEKEVIDLNKRLEENQKADSKHWDRTDIPAWFR